MENFNKIIAVGLTLWSSFTIINYFVPGDIDIKITKDMFVLSCAAAITYKLSESF